jgi:hypothetical protein
MPSTTPTRDQFESYADYGEGVRNNAKRGIELNERNGNKCATQTGNVRAQQLAAVRGFPLKRLNGCTPTFPVRKPTTTTLTVPATAATSPISYGAAKQPLAGAGINYGNLANSTKAPNDEAQVQARMDSLMMVITTLCDCIGAVEESNSPNAFAVKMKIVDKIDELIDKIEY